MEGAKGGGLFMKLNLRVLSAGVFLIAILASCSADEDKTNKIKQKADSLDKEVMEQLENEKAGNDTVSKNQ